MKKAKDVLTNADSRAAYDLTISGTVPPKSMGRKRTFDKDTVLQNVQQEKKLRTTNPTGLNIIEQLQKAFNTQGMRYLIFVFRNQMINHSPSSTNAALSNIVRVNWKKTAYTKEKLMELFSENGLIQDVVLMSKKRKGSALVTFHTVSKREFDNLPKDIIATWMDNKQNAPQSNDININITTTSTVTTVSENDVSNISNLPPLERETVSI